MSISGYAAWQHLPLYVNEINSQESYWLVLFSTKIYILIFQAEIEWPISILRKIS